MFYFSLAKNLFDQNNITSHTRLQTGSYNQVSSNMKASPRFPELSMAGAKKCADVKKECSKMPNH